jgi:hypothetical protein
MVYSPPDAGFLNMCAVAVVSTWYSWRVWISHKSGKRWSTRRLHTVQVAAAELAVNIVLAALFLARNIYAIAQPCSWFEDVSVWFFFLR